MSQKDCKNQAANFGNSRIQHLSEKYNFRVSQFCKVVQNKIILDGIVKRLLIAYFVGNISAKNIRSRVSKL